MAILAIKNASLSPDTLNGLGCQLVVLASMAREAVKQNTVHYSASLTKEESESTLTVEPDAIRY